MTDTSNTTVVSGRTWRSSQAYALAMVFLALGIGVGYLGRGSIRDSAPAPAGGPAASQPPLVNNSGQPDRPTLEQLKHMADKKAEPLLEQLKAQPDNAAVLSEVAHIYVLAHQFKEALPYYERSIRADAKNAGVRADFASCLFYSGETDKAIAALEEALRYEPNSAQALFNLGMLRWRARGDSAGAIALWERLLKTNPDLPDSRKQAVENAIAEARQHGKPVVR